MSEITKIPAHKYDGYLWYSNEDRPRIIEEGQYIERKGEDEEVFSGKIFSPSDVESAIHPFIVEGALFAKDEKISITIRCLDAKYYINQFDLNKHSADVTRSIEHVWHVAKDKRRKAIMEEIWLLKKDDLCEKMQTFYPAFWVFKGFIKK